MSSPDRITYIGHATLLIELNGMRLLTDPLLRHRIAHLRRRRPYPTLDNLLPLDAVLLSHHHRDHMDIPSLKKLGRDVRLIGPPGTAVMLKKLGFTHIEEIKVGETVMVGDVKVEAVFADHDSQRTPFGSHSDCVGYIIHGHSEAASGEPEMASGEPEMASGEVEAASGRTIYFAGDTDIYPAMADIHVDIALMPIWGWGPTLGDGHMDPQTAARALALIHPKMAIPIHWGAFHPIGFGWMNPVFLTLPPITFMEQTAELAPDVPIHVLPPGQSLDL